MTEKRAPTMYPDALMSSRTAAAAQDLGSARVLLADSRSEQRGLIRSFLGQRGYDTVEEVEAGAVLPALEAHAIDIVIVAAGLDGGADAAVAAVREERRYADVPIIFIAGSEDATAPKGSDDLVPTPVDPRALLDKVRGALRTRRSLLGMEQAHAVVASLANELLAP